MYTMLELLLTANEPDLPDEIMLYVEFNGMLHEDILQNPNLAFKVIGFDTDHPVMQIGDEIYEGEYEDAIGTNVLFEEDLNPSNVDTVFAKDVPKRMQYSGKTNKILKMNRIFITEKNKTPAETSSEPTTEFSGTYQEALTKLAECCIKKDANTHIKNP